MRQVAVSPPSTARSTKCLSAPASRESTPAPLIEDVDVVLVSVVVVDGIGLVSGDRRTREQCSHVVHPIA